MERVETVDTPASPAELFAVVEDLGRYPDWLDIVVAADPEPDGTWSVELRGRVGPLARSKRLRMARTVHEPDRRVVFERTEPGRSAWTLTALVEAIDGGSRLTMSLHYGGALWGPVLDRLLADEVTRARPRLVALLDG